MQQRPSFVKVVAVGFLALALVGCSTSNEDNPDAAAPSDAFVGDWVYGGMLTPSCPGFQVDPVDLTGDSATITRTDSKHIQIVLGGTCTVNFSVSGKVATAVSGQTCAFDGGSLGQVTASITSWTLTAGSDGNLTSQVSGSVPAFSCTVSGTGMLTPSP